MVKHKKVKYYYDGELAKLLAEKIKEHFLAFNDKDFINKISISVDDLELKARVEVFADCLHEFLPKDYKKSISILLKILGPENEQETGMFSEGYWLMPVAFFVDFADMVFPPSSFLHEPIHFGRNGESVKRLEVSLQG